MQHEWRKSEKDLYLPGKKPVLIDTPPMRYITISGEGKPGTDAYAMRIGVLYALAFTIKMMPKSGFTPEGYQPYSVYPLEGVYTLAGEWAQDTPLNKDALVYDLMIRQPDFVDDALFAFAVTSAAKKKTPGLELARLITDPQATCVQMLHIGSYDDEPASFAQMDAFTREKGLARTDTLHREIYITNPLRTAPEKLRTVLRYAVRQA